MGSPGGCVGDVTGGVINVVETSFLPPHKTGKESCLLKLPQSVQLKHRNWADAKNPN